MNKLLLQVSQHIECQIINNTDEIIFFMGDYATKFFFIIKGSVDVFAPEFNYAQLIPKDFFKELMRFYKNKDYNLVRQIIMYNEHILSIDFDDIPFVNNIMFYEFLKDFLKDKRTIKEILQFFKDNDKQNNVYYSIIERKLLNKDQDQNNIKEFKDIKTDYFQIIDIEKCILDSFINQKKIRFSEVAILFQDNINTKNFYLPVYKKYATLTENQTFGDYAFFSKTRKRYKNNL